MVHRFRFNTEGTTPGGQKGPLPPANWVTKALSSRPAIQPFVDVYRTPLVESLQ
jgi:hypothetical protein